ncbi:MAG: Hsp20/alpha crystallin family protein [Calditrichaeota bacterium]|nr:MAG: Hsp20/alpha crystallin family protein [Calditrichota bacterium]
MALVRWNPTRELGTLQDEFNRLVERFFGPSMLEAAEELPVSWYPSVDITETRDKLVVMAELPGMKKEDIHITYKDGFLTIEGERKREVEEKEGVNFHRVERHYGKFRRTFQLPVAVKGDQIEATYKDGILTITLPKVEEARVKEIPVK